ncbi:MAG: hypothetical protein AB7O66_15410 [Limisphaerales bacterium]
MKFQQKKRAGSTVLGIAVERDRIEIVELRRTNGSSEIRRTVTVPLEADPLGQDPETLGRTLRTHLEQAGVRESRCAVALPVHAALALTITLPELPEADRQSFLEIEAERGFPHNPDSLIRQVSVGQPFPGGHSATVIAFEREVIHRIESILRAARLKPAAFTLGLTSLQPPASEETEVVLILQPSGHQLVVQIIAGRGLAALRVIDDAFVPAAESTELEPDLDLIHRELRITLGQLPAGIRERLRQVRVVGSIPLARSFADVLQPRLESLGVTAELVSELQPGTLPFSLPPRSPASAALAVAVDAAAGRPPHLDFLPPRVSAWREMAHRYSSRKLTWAGGAGGVIVTVVVLAFLGQQLFLWRWQSRWDAIKTKVGQIEVMQREVRRYGPWFDDSVRSLSVLRRLTEAFPEDGSVSAKTIEIRGPSRVACTGTARDPQAWLKMLDNVRGAPGISDVQVEQVRGKSPVEFSFNFQWQGDPRS